MQKNREVQRSFGLLGKQISYSFSRGYFAAKFEKLGLAACIYENFDLESIELLPALLKKRTDLEGLNVTIPYKEAVIPYLDKLDAVAEEIGAVNTIRFLSDGSLKGYNTDAYGFEESIKPYLNPEHKIALILGTGGASKAIKYVLNNLGLQTTFVSRSPKNKDQIGYDELDEGMLAKAKVLVNCTPLGTFPDVGAHPDIDYSQLTDQHLLYDLIYNPELTAFLKKGMAQGCMTLNGLKMLELQAEKSWKIWNTKK